MQNFRASTIRLYEQEPGGALRLLPAIGFVWCVWALPKVQVPQKWVLSLSVATSPGPLKIHLYDDGPASGIVTINIVVSAEQQLAALTRQDSWTTANKKRRGRGSDLA